MSDTPKQTHRPFFDFFVEVPADVWERILRMEMEQTLRQGKKVGHKALLLLALDALAAAEATHV